MNQLLSVDVHFHIEVQSRGILSGILKSDIIPPILLSAYVSFPLYSDLQHGEVGHLRVCGGSHCYLLSN